MQAKRADDQDPAEFAHRLAGTFKRALSTPLLRQPKAPAKKHRPASKGRVHKGKSRS